MHQNHRLYDIIYIYIYGMTHTNSGLVSFTADLQNPEQDIQ